tara:strand:- start:3099 stop:3893 length:795 start_codon:yes stop_codon:yes gene_type:complete
VNKIIKKIKKDYFLLSSILIHLLIFVFAIILSDFHFIYKKPIKYIEITEIQQEYNDIDNEAERFAKNTNKAEKEKALKNKKNNYSPPSKESVESKFSKKREKEDLEEEDKSGDLKKTEKKNKKQKDLKDKNRDSIKNQASIFKPDMSSANAKTEATVDLNTKEFKYISYMLKIKRKIEMVWEYPPESKNRGEVGKVLVKMSISRDGKLIDVKILQSSGFKRLDNESKSSIIKAAPYPPFPKSWGNLQKLNIRVAFYYAPGAWDF